ncbi:hypothetical protein ACA910_020457 [Epithemia clementina (nom. ined.)]
MAHKTAICKNPPYSANARVSFPDETSNDAFDEQDVHPDSTPSVDEDHPISENELFTSPNDDTINNMIHAYQTKLSCITKPSRPGEIKMAAHYHVAHAQASHFGSLVDRGTNGGVVGAEVCILSCNTHKISITGIGNHELSNLDIVTCAGIINTNHGHIVLIMNEYAYYGQATPSILLAKLSGKKTSG